MDVVIGQQAYIEKYLKENQKPDKLYL